MKRVDGTYLGIYILIECSQSNNCFPGYYTLSNFSNFPRRCYLFQICAVYNKAQYPLCECFLFCLPSPTQHTAMSNCKESEKLEDLMDSILREAETADAVALSSYGSSPQLYGKY